MRRDFVLALNSRAQGIGIGLSQRFYETVVGPILQEHFPNLPHAACRIGIGSEVLGYDTEMSADHDYGPCVQLFLPGENFAALAPAIMEILDRSLPTAFEERAVRYPTHVRPPGSNSVEGMLGSDHGVELYTLSAWSDRFLGRQFETDLTARDWLSYSEQLFLTEPEDVFLALTSYPPGDTADDAQLATFRDAITEAFQAGNGVLEVGKESGLFISKKAA